MKKKKTCKKAILIYLSWVICNVMVNYLEIQDFVELSFISLLRYTWDDIENVLENCENVLENCLNFFLETCTHHGCNFKNAFFNLVLLIDICRYSRNNALMNDRGPYWWSDDRSPLSLVQVMACVVRPKWVNCMPLSLWGWYVISQALPIYWQLSASSKTADIPVH